MSKSPMFLSLEPDEDIVLFRRKSLIALLPIWLGQSILLLIGALIILLVFSWSMSLTGSPLESLNLILRPILLLSAFAVLLVLLLVWVRILWRWFFQMYVVTTKRVIAQTGFIAKNKKEASLDKVQIATASSEGPYRQFLNVGNVRIETAAFLGAIDFDLIYDPNTALSTILQQLDKHRQEEEMLKKDEVAARLKAHLKL